MLKKLKEYLDSKIITGGIILSGILTNLLGGTVAYAKDFEFLTKDSGNGAFSDLTDTVKETSASGYQLMMVIGGVGLILSTIVLGISFAYTKNSTKKSENKSHLPAIAGGAILIFGAVAIVGLLQSIATKI